jgi:hypothetical protein
MVSPKPVLRRAADRTVLELPDGHPGGCLSDPGTGSDTTTETGLSGEKG